MDGIELILTTISKKYFKMSDMGDVVQQEKKSTTPQQFEKDHTNLMTMRNIKLV
jgi:hypothetical protein